MKRTPLYKTHQAMGARLVEFGGWDMPVQYSGIRAEHVAVRNQVGLFDVSHMGEISLRGPEALKHAQRLTCNDLNRLAPNQCQYSALLTPEGTFVDDILVYPFSPDHVLFCVNASNTDKDFEWIQSYTQGAVRAENDSAAWCQLALQGPRAPDVLASCAGPDVRDLKRFFFRFVSLFGEECLVSRTGYTGEDGFEIYGPATHATTLWEGLMAAGRDHGILPCGLGARDTLRLEVSYPLYGHEIDDTINPFEAGLAWIVKLDSDDFIGKDKLCALQAAGVSRRLIGFQMEDRSIPRQDYPIIVDKSAVGHVVSGTLSLTLNVGIGTGYVPAEMAAAGGKIAIDIRGKKRKAAIVSLPFYRKQSRQAQ